MKINEYKLNEKLKEFNYKNVIIYFNELFYAKIKMNYVKINYNIRSGYLKIKDKLNNRICINIVSARQIEARKEEIKIKLDNGINIGIKQN